MTLSYDLFWSFRSPYSYLITPRLAALEREYDVRAVVRPVYPLAVRTPEFFTAQDPLWVGYLMRDIQREAEFLGLPIRWPRPDPVKMDFATRTYPKEQPHIHRLTQMGAAAAELGHGLSFLDEVSRLIWSGTVDDWHQGDHLAKATERAGLDRRKTKCSGGGQSGRSARGGSLWGADDRLQRGTLFRPGSLRPVQMAAGAARVG
jgi:2-hydroxychromene-2-carboxylate isomerase